MAFFESRRIKAKRRARQKSSRILANDRLKRKQLI